MSPRIRVSLVRCGRCRRRYSNPLTHICRTRIGQRQTRTRIRPRIALDCPKCHRPMPNPVTHVCRARTDFRRRAAAAKRSRAADLRAQRRSIAKVGRARTAGPGKQRHLYQKCTDESCARVACVAYREGIEACPLEHA